MKIKSYRELLIILREHIVDERGFFGMCGSISELSSYGKITSDEYYKLTDFVNINRPKRGKFFDKRFADDSYYWESTIKQPRLEWIDHHIAQLERYVNRHIIKTKK